MTRELSADASQVERVGFRPRFVAELLDLAAMWPLWDRERQTFHDKLAGTLVVRRSDLPTGITS